VDELLVIDERRPDLGGNIRHGDANTYCPKLWTYLIERFALRSMLDVGCGEGNAVHFFHKRGVYAHGIDGLRRNVDNAVVPIALHDLLGGSYIMPVDLVWTCEVAEHIDPAHVDNFIDTLANGRIVAMTHALPGQAGHHHVNCQAPEYWIDLMASRGFSLERSQDAYRAISRTEDYPTYFASSGLVFVRQ
jgi:SAM-dependent methyltransferase